MLSVNNMIGFGGAVTPDAAKTLLLLHGEDNLNDSSSFARTVTNYGMYFDPAYKKFGLYGFFGTTTAYCTTPATGLTFTGDFTIDFWFYSTTNEPTNNVFLGWNLGQTDNLQYTTGTFKFGTASFAVSWYDSGMSNHAWVHVAVVRSGSSIKLYINGVNKGSTITRSTTVGSTAGSNTFAINTYAGSYGFDQGYDEFRLSNVARWTTNFTPPTGPYSAD